MGTQPVLPLDPAWQRRLSLGEYHHMIDAGVFDEDDHLELLEGVLVAMSPQNPVHARVIEYLDWALQRALPGDYRVRVQLPLTLPEFSSEPEPDMAVIDRRDGPWSRHPERAVLVIEIADTSLQKDREAKARLYAGSMIPEYWIVNCRDHNVEVFRSPTSDGYEERLEVSVGAQVTCAGLPTVSVSVDELFAAHR